MPWKETSVMDERVRFVSRLLNGERMSDLCREFGISRVTGTKFRDRYFQFGSSGLANRSRRPHQFGNECDEETLKRVIGLRELYPTWGPKKLRVKLEELFPGLYLPAASTIGEILDRNGLTKQRRKRIAREKFGTPILTQGIEPNDVWCVDFKGQFRLKNDQYCYPLTATDFVSRFLLGCEALSSTRTGPSIAAFEAIFDEFGVPRVIRSDNGTPFSSRSLGGLSELSVWWMGLGITPERIQPGCPEQNGRHERMHRTLKQETTRPAANNLLAQQERFDQFATIYNSQRPHEALEMKTPSTLYRKSLRTLKEANQPFEYALHDRVCRVGQTGVIKLKGHSYFVGRAFRGQELGLREITSHLFQVSFVNTDLGFLDVHSSKFLLENPLAPEREQL